MSDIKIGDTARIDFTCSICDKTSNRRNHARPLPIAGWVCDTCNARVISPLRSITWDRERDLRALLDDVGAPRTDKAESRLTRELTVGERIRALAAERDRAVDAERLTREAHKKTIAENIELRARIDAMTKLAAGPIDTEGQPG